MKDKDLIDRMLSFDEWKHLSFEEVCTLIDEGEEILTREEEIKEKEGRILSHYDISERQKDAMSAAARYRNMVQFKEEGFDFDSLDEEE